MSAQRSQDLLEQLLERAQKFDTTYMLKGRIAYPDEIFNVNGFMPLIARMAERRLKRVLEDAKVACGFSYLPHRNSVFKEILMVAPEKEGMLADSIILSTLDATSRELLGMGISGVMDLTPVYEAFTNMDPEQRNALKDKELTPWPLFQPIRVQ